MAELVSNTADIPPRHVGTKLFRVIGEPDGGFADDLEFTFDGEVYRSIIAIASRMSANHLRGGLSKDKY